LLFGLERRAAAGREAVELGFAVVGGCAPAGGKQALTFEAVESWIECALFDREGAAGDLLDAEEDAVAVHFTEGDGFEDEEVEGALEEFGGRGLFPRHFREG